MEKGELGVEREEGREREGRRGVGAGALKVDEKKDRWGREREQGEGDGKEKWGRQWREEEAGQGGGEGKEKGGGNAKRMEVGRKGGKGKRGVAVVREVGQGGGEGKEMTPEEKGWEEEGSAR